MSEDKTKDKKPVSPTDPWDDWPNAGKDEAQESFLHGKMDFFDAGLETELKELRNRMKILEPFEQVIIQTPPSQRPQLLDTMKRFSDKAKFAPLQKLPEDTEGLKALGIVAYPQWRKQHNNTNAKQCLKEFYSPWLKIFSPQLDRDYMTQADLQKLDKQLLQRLRRLYPAAELSEFLPSLPMLNKQLADLATDAERKEAGRMNAVIYRHGKK